MKLWLISQSINNGYDTYDSAVVAAETEILAKETYPAINDFTYTYHDNSWWWIWKGHISDERQENGGGWATNADQVDAEYIGDAVKGTEAGVICASFNAG